MCTPELKIQSAKRKVKTELYKGTTTDHAINEERPGRPPKDSFQLTTTIVTMTMFKASPQIRD